MIPELNRIYVYDHTKYGNHAASDSLSAKAQNVHYRYKQNNVPMKSEEGEIIRFAQTVSFDGLSRTLLFITKNHERGNDQILRIISDIKKNPKDMEVLKIVGKTPKPLSVFYAG